jgi:hypothetical protein
MKKAPLLLMMLVCLFLTSCGKGNENVLSSEAESETAQGVADEVPEAVTSVEAETSVENTQDTLEYQVKQALETLEVWDCSVADSYAGGTGSAEDPYQIATAAQLAKLSEDSNAGIDFTDIYFVLTSDILLHDISDWSFTDMYDNYISVHHSSSPLDFDDYRSTYSTLSDETTHGWLPIGFYYPFRGNFDGAGYTIYGMTSGNIYSDGYLDNNTPCAGLFGELDNATISNVTLCCSVIDGYRISYAGSIAGKAVSSTIENCHAQQFLISTSSPDLTQLCSEFSAGGLLGKAEDSSILGSSASGYLRIGYGVYRGGLFTIGGIVGAGDTVINCYSAMDITIGFYQGRFTSNNIYVGGIAGSCGTIELCNSVGYVEVGELWSWSMRDVQQYSITRINETSDTVFAVGGICGQCTESIKNCASSGAIECMDAGNTYLGGIAGGLDSYAVIEFCMSNERICDVSTDGEKETEVGGIVGLAGANTVIQNSYYNTISQASYDAFNAFGIAADDSVVVENVEDLFLRELREAQSYQGWDFDTLWMIDPGLNNGCPILRSQESYYR